MSLKHVYENILGAFSVGAAVILKPIIQNWYTRYGASPDELARTLPGDDLVTHPSMSYTRAISIDAPPAVVWAFLVQLGQERGGLYSYDLLENLAGCDIHNADRIVPEWQHIAVGDVVRLGPKSKHYPLYKVVRVIPEHAIVMQPADPKTEIVAAIDDPPPAEYVIGMWTLALDPLHGGQSTRLITRGKMEFNPSRANRIIWGLTDVINFVMERKMLVTIKHLAEQYSINKQVVTPAANLA